MKDDDQLLAELATELHRRLPSHCVVRVRHVYDAVCDVVAETSLQSWMALWQHTHQHDTITKDIFVEDVRGAMLKGNSISKLLGNDPAT